MGYTSTRSFSLWSFWSSGTRPDNRHGLPIGWSASTWHGDRYARELRLKKLRYEERIMLKRDVDEHCSKHRPERHPNGQTYPIYFAPDWSYHSCAQYSYRDNSRKNKNIFPPQRAVNATSTTTTMAMTTMTAMTMMTMTTRMITMWAAIISREKRGRRMTPAAFGPQPGVGGVLCQWILKLYCLRLDEIRSHRLTASGSGWQFDHDISPKCGYGDDVVVASTCIDADVEKSWDDWHEDKSICCDLGLFCCRDDTELAWFNLLPLIWLACCCSNCSIGSNILIFDMEACICW